MHSSIIPFPDFSEFPVKTNPKHTPIRHVRMDDALIGALERYGKRSGIGNVSAVIRFACANLLRDDGAFQVVNPQPPAQALK